ncbi:primosomal replication protein N [Uliginosibacterium sp. H3]|uniref:Replication restart protein PriB n=1 Tax=Uliginosibacterium silvisoli TaxID=3114758 RepID=A0ABU6K954_9RHOO|nr:primosomal replication protein N [Uliginosibacterium sp. H3]
MGEAGVRNIVAIAGSLMERDALRMTPARIPVVGFKIRHTSVQIELEVERNVSCEMSVLAIGPLASQITALPMGVEMLLEGFLAARSARHQTPVLHVTKFELLEARNNVEGTK